MHLSALSVLVPDYDAGIAFFCDALGFELIDDIDQGDGKRWIRVQPPGAQTGFILARAVGTDQIAAVGAQGGGRVWLFLETDDFDQSFSTLSDNGVVFQENPRNEPYGKVAVFEDPFGNRWDLIQFRAKST